MFNLPGLSVIQSHPLCRICFGRYQASSAVLGRQGGGNCYLMHTLMYIYRPHLLPSHHHCVLTKCAGFTRNQENSGSHSTAMTPSRLRTHIVSSRRKEAVQMSTKCQWKEGSMKPTYWIECVHPSTGQVSSREASVRHLSVWCYRFLCCIHA